MALTLCLSPWQAFIGSLPARGCDPDFFTSMGGPFKPGLCASSALYLTCLYLAFRVFFSSVVLFALPCTQLHCFSPSGSLCSCSPPLQEAPVIFWFHRVTEPHRQAFIVQFVTSTWLSSVSLSVGGESFACSQRNGHITSPLSFSFYLFGKHFLSTCCLLVLVLEDKQHPSYGPREFHSGRGETQGTGEVQRPVGTQ